MAKKKKKKKPELKIYKGYTEGQTVFFICISDGKLGYGRINDFHPNCKDMDSDSEGERADAVTIICYMRGSYQTAYLRDIIDEPTKKHISQRDAAIGLLKRPPRKKGK